MIHVVSSLGAGHDGDNSCTGGINIMAATLPGGKGALKWSSCTGNLFQRFLRSVLHGNKRFVDYRVFYANNYLILLLNNCVF